MEPVKDRLFKRNDFGILRQISLTSLVYSVYGRLLLLIRDVRFELCLQASEICLKRKRTCKTFSSNQRAGFKCCDSS